MSYEIWVRGRLAALLEASDDLDPTVKVEAALQTADQAALDQVRKRALRSGLEVVQVREFSVESAAPAVEQPGVAAADMTASTPSATVPEPATDTIAELERLSRLYEAGALLDEEFLAAKAHVLGI